MVVDICGGMISGSATIETPGRREKIIDVVHMIEEV
jgi:hypothetical protein